MDIFVSLGALDRALALANDLFLSLQEKSHRVTFAPLDQHLRRLRVDERSKPGRERFYGRGWEPDRPTVVYVGTVAIGLTIFELSEEMEVKYVDGKYIPTSRLLAGARRPRPSGHDWIHRRDMPTGRLCIRATSPYRLATWEAQWREEGKSKLGPEIPQIVLELEAAAITVAKLVEEGERKAELEQRKMKEEQERWRREELEKQRQENIKRSRDQLFGIIESWGTARQMEGFFEDAERRATSLGDAAAAEVRGRVARARELLGGVDALQRFRAWKAPDER